MVKQEEIEWLQSNFAEVIERVKTYGKIPKTLGINAHPFMQSAYKGNYKEQGDIIRSMGMDACRVDIKVDTDAKMLKDFYLQMQGIELYPMLYPAGLSLTNPDQYSQGYNTAYSFCYNYAPYFKTIELGNELELKIIKSTGYDGTKLEHYDETGLKAITSYLKGMVTGVRAVGLHKIIIDGTWLHFAFIQYLLDNGVDFDILGWHWYDNQDRLRAKSTSVPIEETLFNKFGKPIMFNEVGVRNEGKLTEENIAANMTLLVNRLQASEYVEKVFIYELFKQPYLGAIWEREYGIYLDVKTPTQAVSSIASISGKRQI